MLLELLIQIPIMILWGINGLLPSYETLPLPDWFYPNITQVFQTMRLILELPVIRVMYGYFIIILPIWFILWKWNFIIKTISLIPFLGGLDKFKIKAEK